MFKLHLCCPVKVRTSHCLCEKVWTDLPLFVCPSHIGCSRCPVWISFNVNLLSLSIRIQWNVRATRAALPCLFLCALPEWTSTGYGNIGSLIWIIRQRHLRYLCSRCIEMSVSDIARHSISQQTAVWVSIRRAHKHLHPTFSTLTHSCVHTLYWYRFDYIASNIIYSLYPASRSEWHFLWTLVVYKNLLNDFGVLD